MHRARTRTLSAIDTRTGEILDSVEITTGGAPNARRVPSGFGRIYYARPGVVLQVNTSRGPSPRRLVFRGGTFYTRTVVL